MVSVDVKHHVYLPAYLPVVLQAVVMMSGMLPGFLSEQHVTYASADHSTETHHGTARHEYGVGHRMEDKQNSAAAEQSHHNQSHDSTVAGNDTMHTAGRSQLQLF